MPPQQKLPIGVFDSGLGGLTVVKEIARFLPTEQIIYVGDTARVPYGTKSPATIRRYATQIAFFLLQKKVKMIVVACNSASAVAMAPLKRFPIPVVGVIEPGARAAINRTKNKRVGVIGTQATILSGSYRRALKKLSPGVRVIEKACPLFVPLVEEGRFQGKIPSWAANEYLHPLKKAKIDTLVLGCTHYPLLKSTLQKVVGPRIQLIDSAQETALEVKAQLGQWNCLNPSKRPQPNQFFTTDSPFSFARWGGQFLGRRVGPARRLSLDTL